jgi:hypothetical protein
MKAETYAQARARLLTHLAANGWRTKPALKVPQACRPDATLYFRQQAVYLDAHSMWIDIRGMSEAEFDATVARWIRS